MGEVIQILYEKDGVFVHANAESVDEDVLIEGKVTLARKQHGIFIEWAEVSGSKGADWTVLDRNASYSKRDNLRGERENVIVTTGEATGGRSSVGHKYYVNFDITELKSFRRSKPQLGWSYLLFVQRCGTTHPALHFHRGGTRELIEELHKFLIIKKSEADHCLYLVNEHNPEALTKSFDELHLFGEQTGHIVSKFIRHPMTTTLSSFAKFTNSLRDALLVRDMTSEMPNYVIAPAIDELPGVSLQSVEDSDFEYVTAKYNLPPRPAVSRSRPLTSQMWSSHMDAEGRVKDVDRLKDIIFHGGVENDLRVEVWKFLLGFYGWDSTYKSRAELRKKRVDDYFAMKLQWKSVTADQERRFSQMRDRKSLVEKDVNRTDRKHPFFRDDDNPNLQVLYDILMTYCMYDFDLGYVQGMSDLLAPILVVMENEVDAFWCLAGLMDMLHSNFELDQEGMKTQLLQLNTLLKFYDPDFYNYLESHDSNNMYFCFRWLLVQFKREFSFPDTMRLWEVLWTGKPCANFHLLVCMAILDTHKTTLVESNFGFTEILKHINDLSNTIDLETTLTKAEAIALQIEACHPKPDAVSSILGIATTLPNGSNGRRRRLSTSSTSSTSSTPERSVPAGHSSHNHNHHSVELKAVGSGT